MALPSRMNTTLLRSLSLALLFAAAMTGGGCTTPRTAPEKNVSDALFRTWMESHEERSDDTEVYRDSSFEFPPARGREGFTIESTGEFTWHRIAPTDGNMDVPARWHFENGSTTVLLVSDPATGRDTDRIVILSIEPTVLKVTRTGL